MILCDVRRRMISQQNQLISPLYLFNSGLGADCQCIQASGGWHEVGVNNRAGYRGVRVYNNRLYNNNTGNYTYSGSNKTAIKLVGYARLCVEYTWTDNHNMTTGGYGNVRISLAENVADSSPSPNTSSSWQSGLTNRLTTATISALTSQKTILTINLTRFSKAQLSIPRKIAISHYSGSGWTRYISIYRIWLEK